MSGRPVIMDESVRFADAEEAAAAVLGFANGVRRAATGHAPTYLGHVFRYEPQGSEAACPFCHPGDRLSLEEAADCAGGARYYVMCSDCAACGPIEDSPEAAWASWGSRRRRSGALEAASAAGSAAQSAALPACAPLTVGDVVHVAGYPDWHAQGGIGEAPEGALKAEPGEVFIPIADVAEVIEKAIKDSAPKPKPAALAMPLPSKEVCQNTAKSETASRVLNEDRTAEYMRYLEYGA